jgi:hypothetical protein
MTQQQPSPQDTEASAQRRTYMDASASIMDFVVTNADTSQDGIIALQRNIPNINALCAQELAEDPSAELSRYTQSRDRAQAFLAAHGAQ